MKNEPARSKKIEETEEDQYLSQFLKGIGKCIMEE